MMFSEDNRLIVIPFLVETVNDTFNEDIATSIKYVGKNKRVRKRKTFTMTL
ncbi:hypothetical protein P0136_04730 [Lentisphaerota bacterium ZTH]|nr:hypothetical protein JYG24_04150 [Lentisphaerota bacterium]WET07295.1 hypothetical protein P0136_04730 [Lentisphaerota bacterium ZTH]